MTPIGTTPLLGPPGGNSLNEAPHKSSAPLQSTKAGQAEDPEYTKAAQAAKQFEAIFVRKMLSSLEKAKVFGGSQSGSSGTEVYGSMMVGALADAATQGDGIGLSELVLRALTESTTSGRPAESKPPK
ncbi:MAG: hypothetical protein RJA70_3597 [Pseudomonadota bacterium]|jgi:Rod binding domain-containing protein